MRKLGRLFLLTCVLSLTGVEMGHAAEIELTSTAGLRAKYADLAPQLANNAFGRPLVLESTEATGNLGVMSIPSCGIPMLPRRWR